MPLPVGRPVAAEERAADGETEREHERRRTLAVATRRRLGLAIEVDDPPLIADVDDPLLAEEVERGVPALSIAEAGVLYATEWHMGLAAQGRQVYMEHPRLRFLRVPERGAKVVRVDR